MVDTDLQERVDAYYLAENEEDGVSIPSFWTPEWVLKRLVDAYDVLSRTRMVIWPKEPGNWMPTPVRDYADTNDVQAYVGRQEELAHAAHRASTTPRAEELSQADQAIHWCAHYLKSFPLEADAVGLWSRCEATGDSVANVLRIRKERAVKMAASAQAIEDRDQNRARAQAAAAVAAWANTKIAMTDDPDKIARIKSNAHIRLGRALEKAPRFIVTPSSCLPGKVIGRKALDQSRKSGAKIIADGLNKDGVVVW